jgi:hypothetical protein
VEEIIDVMRAAGDGPDGLRLRGVIVLIDPATHAVKTPIPVGRAPSGVTAGAGSV